jgi:hypothetical protein
MTERTAAATDAEYSSLREEMLRANDQAMSLKGYTLASVALVVGAAVSTGVSPNTRLVLFSALQIVLLVITIQVGARRRQQASIAAYLGVFHEPDGAGWESRLRTRRSAFGATPVDLWYGWSEAAFTILIALVGLAGSIWAVAQSVDSHPAMLILAWAINSVVPSVTIWQSLSRRVVQDLMTGEIQAWESLAAAEADPLHEEE